MQVQVLAEVGVCKATAHEEERAVERARGDDDFLRRDDDFSRGLAVFARPGAFDAGSFLFCRGRIKDDFFDPASLNELCSICGRFWQPVIRRAPFGDAWTTFTTVTTEVSFTACVLRDHLAHVA